MKAFLKKWWPPLVGLAAFLTFAGYVAFIDIPRMQERQATILAWAEENCTPVPKKTGEPRTIYWCNHVMAPTKGGLIYITAVLSNGGVWAWQEHGSARKPKALWTVPVECLRRPAAFEGLLSCSTLEVEPNQFESMTRNLFKR